MEVQAVNLSDVERARSFNQKELKHAHRSLRTRIALLVLFLLMTVMATVGYTSGVEDLLLLIAPSGAMALVFLLLTLDKWAHCSEIRERNWVAITPRFSKWRRDAAPDQGTSDRPAEVGAT